MGLNFKPKSIALVLASAVYAGGVQAADFDDADELLDLYGEEETLSISTGTNKPIRLAPSVATVVTQDDIERRGLRTLDEILETVPGLHVSVSSTNLLNPVYSIRGIHTSQNAQVLLLIDGAPIRQLFNSSRPTLFDMPVRNIKRVEVIRGPGSAVYGADAFSGVINVVTKGAQELGSLVVGSRVGTFDTQEVWVQGGKELDAGQRVHFSMEYLKTDGDKSRIIERDFQTLLDAFFATNASQAPGALATQKELLNIHTGWRSDNLDVSLYWWHLEEAGLGAGGAQALDYTGFVEGDYVLLDVLYKNRISEDWRYELELTAAYYDQQQRLMLLPPGTIVPIGNDGNISFTGRPTQFTDGVFGNPGGTDRRQSIELVNYYSGWDGHSLRLSLGYILQDGDPRETKNFGPGVLNGGGGSVDGTLTDVTGTPFVYVDPDLGNIRFMSIQDEWSLAADWELTVGVRYDNYPDFGDTLNPRLALVWATSYSLTSKLLYGRAFRAPSSGELFAINNPVILGNPNLEPEIIDTMELAFDYKPNVVSNYKLNLFYYDVRDLIEYRNSPDLPAATSRAENAGDQDGHGFEFEFSYTINDRIDIEGNYAWQRSTDQNNNSTVALAPKSQAYIAVDVDLGDGWIFDASSRWVAGRERRPGDTRKAIDDYTVIDIALSKKQIVNKLDMRIQVKNLFDEEVLEPSDSLGITVDYPLSGRAAFIELEYSLD